MHRRQLFLIAIVIALLLAALVTEPALAQQGNPGDAGKNLADLITRILGPLLFAIAAAIGLAAVVRRDWGLAITLVGLVLVIGSFLIPNTPWVQFTETVAEQVFGTRGGDGSRSGR